MQNQPIAIPRALVNQMLHHAQLCPDQEVCGLVGANNQNPVRCYPIRNIADNPSTHYEMDPSEQFAVMRKMKNSGEELFAIYHSHPHSNAQPSPTDIDMANYPEAVYLIISLNTKGVLEMRGFQLLPDKPAQEVLLLLENE